MSSVPAKLRETLATRRRLFPPERHHMNFKHLALAFALLAGCASPRSSPSAWEYKTVTGTVIGGMPQQRLDAVINKHVAEGWKFVSAGQAADQWGFAVLKRKVKPGNTVPANRPTNEIHA